MKKLILLSLFSICFLGLNAQASISMDRGTSYSIISTETVQLYASLQCGYTDFGTPKVGLFTRETRQYVTKNNSGQIIKRWNETVDVFVNCLPNQ